MTDKIIKIETRINNVLFWLCFFVTFLAIFMALLEFFSKGEYPPSNINIFYVGILIIYALHKEALRFLERSQSKRVTKGGEIFVYVWIIMTACLYLLNFLTKGFYTQDSTALLSMSFTALEVGAVFVLARILKLLMIRLFNKK